MIRRALPLFLFLSLLIVLLVGLSHLLPETEDAAAPLSVKILREGEGNAVIFCCGGQTAVFSTGTSEDAADLTSRLRNYGCNQIDLLVCTDMPQEIGPLEEAASVLRAAGPVELSEQTVLIGDARLYISDTAAEGSFSLAVSHGTNDLLFLFGEDAQASTGKDYDFVCFRADAPIDGLLDALKPKYAVLLASDADAERTAEKALRNQSVKYMTTGKSSISVYSDGTDLSLRPEFSAWDE